MFSEDCIHVYLWALISSLDSPKLFLPSVSLHLESLTSPISYQTKLFLGTLLLKIALIIFWQPRCLSILCLFCLNIIIAMVGYGPQNDKGLVLSPWCYGKWELIWLLRVCLQEVLWEPIASVTFLHEVLPPFTPKLQNCHGLKPPKL